MPGGGWQGHPNSLKALRPGRIGLLPKCKKPGCGNVRVKGANRCRLHGGAGCVKKTTPRQQRIRDARRIIDRAARAGTLPAALVAQDIWARCGVTVLVPMRPLLLSAWLSADPAAWSQALLRVEQEIGGLSRASA